MDQKDIKKLLDAQAKRIEGKIKTHVGALVEDFDAKVELISEQHTSVMRVLENHTRRLQAIEERLVGLDIRMGRVEEGLSRVENRLKKIVDYEEFQGLVKRVALLESRLSRKI